MIRCAAGWDKIGNGGLIVGSSIMIVLVRGRNANISPQLSESEIVMHALVEQNGAETDDTVEISESPTGRGFRLQARQVLPVPREAIFAFFADAGNLQRLTPPWLQFNIVTPTPIAMRSGAVIDYRLRLHGINLRWRSRIAVWDPPLTFADEQIRGPYRCWRHEHIFEVTDAGTLCRDVVDYRVLGGRLIHRWLVRRDLLAIFAYRQEKLRELFCNGKSRQ